MSFAPNPRYGTGMSPVVRTVLFWVLMVALAVVLWQASSKSKDTGSSHQISYSDFLQQVDKNNIGAATFVLADNTADVSGNLRDPAQEYTTTVPRESVSDLTDRLRKQGTVVNISEAPKQTRANFLVNLAPLLLLVGFWIFMMNRMRVKQAPPQNPTNIPPSNTPL
jgi:cell division protease FtsH